VTCHASNVETTEPDGAARSIRPANPDIRRTSPYTTSMVIGVLGSRGRRSGTSTRPVCLSSEACTRCDRTAGRPCSSAATPPSASLGAGSISRTLHRSAPCGRSIAMNWLDEFFTLNRMVVDASTRPSPRGTNWVSICAISTTTGSSEPRAKLWTATSKASAGPTCLKLASSGAPTSNR